MNDMTVSFMTVLLVSLHASVSMVDGKYARLKRLASRFKCSKCTMFPRS